MNATKSPTAVRVTTPELHVFEIDDGEHHWFSAASADGALAMHLAMFDMTREAFVADYGEPQITQRPDDETMEVIMLDEPGEPRVTKTCREWCKEGPGLISTTCY